MRDWVRVGLAAVAAAGVLKGSASTAQDAPGPPLSSDVEELKKQNVELQRRVDKLSKEVDELQGKVAYTQKSPPETPPKVPVTADLGIELYGFVKLDAAHDSEAISFGDYLRWVNSQQTVRDQAQFNMTANETRLGARIKGPSGDNLRVGGDVEMDFYSFVGSEDTPSPRLRYGYLNLELPRYHFSLLAGQAPDVISPLIQPSVNFAVGWWMGDIGFRRPQIRLTEDVSLDQDVGLKFEVAATRTVASGFLGGTDYSTDPGAEGAFPGIQGRTSLTFPGVEHLKTMVGVWGLWGNDKHNLTNNSSVAGNRFTTESWVLGMDAVVPLQPWLKLQASGYTGADLDTYLGGIGQGVNGLTRKPLGDRGLWVAATLGPFGGKDYEYSPTEIGRGLPVSGPWGRWVFNLGWTRDWVRSADLAGLPNARQVNGAEFANVYYSITHHVIAALEVMHARTAYKGIAAGNDWREQIAFIYTF